MISSFLIALREGLEAALVVGIVLVYLNRTGRSHLSRFVWAGVGLAAALSLAAAVALEKWQISEDGFEGVMMLVAAVFVVTMILWMNHVARHLRKHIERRVDSLSGKIRSRGRIGPRHLRFSHGRARRRGTGADPARRRAVERRPGGVDRHRRWDLPLAIAVGVFFFQGTLKIPLGRFFAVTSAILIIVADATGAVRACTN